MSQLSTSLVAAPTAEPITLAEAKVSLKINPEITDEDSYLASLIVAGREYVEAFMHRAVPLQTWDLALDAFPYDDSSPFQSHLATRSQYGAPIWLPKAPAVSVTSVTYVAPDGTSTIWAPALYTTNLPTGPRARCGCIEPAYGQYYPLTRVVPNAVVVRFVAGYVGTPLPVATLTQADGLATATVTAGHGVTDLQRVTIAGAAQAGYNGTFTARVLNATQFTVPVVATTVSPATGTITVTPDPVPIMIKMCMLEHVRAHYGRGADDRVEILDWINRNLWSYKSF